LSKFDSKPVTRLTDLEVYEVSLVDKGAIGEVFTVIKSEDGNTELVDKLKEDDDEICRKLQTMTDAEFVKIMGQMMQRYNSINENVNKGGSGEMNEEAIKALVAEVVGSAMDSVNKNFVAVNKSIDEIQKKLNEAPTQASEDDKKKKEEEAKEGEITKAVADIGTAVKSLSDLVTSISKSLESVTSQVQKISDMKLDETLADVSKRLETIEKQENPSNGVEVGEEVQKGAGEKKEVFWKSFLTPVQE